MICPNCHSEIEDGAKFCTHCGANLSPQPTNEKDYSSILLFTWVITTIVFSLVQICITKFVTDWYSNSGTRVIYGILCILQNIALMLIPLSIKNRTLKIIGSILIGLLVIYYIYSNIGAWFTNPF